MLFQLLIPQMSSQAKAQGAGPSSAAFSQAISSVESRATLMVLVWDVLCCALLCYGFFK